MLCTPFARSSHFYLLCSIVAVSILFTGCILAPATANAATYTVMTTNDTIQRSCGAVCPLRDAIIAVNADRNGTIEFNWSVTGPLN